MATRPRTDLSDYLKEQTGITRLYFQQPSTVRMTYPCIRYELDEIEQRHADNSKYITNKSYLLTLITEDPDSEYIDKLAALPMCRFNRSYEADNLHHYVYQIYY